MKLIYTLTGIFFFLLLSGFVFADGDGKVGEDGQLNSLTVRPLTIDTDDNRSPFIVADGSGRAIVGWDQDKAATGFDVAAQMMLSNANIAWGDVGSNVSNATGNQQVPVALSLGAGGTIVAFADNRSGGWQVYAMRMNQAGSQVWGSNGVLVATSGLTGPDVKIDIASDGAGGAIIVWELEFSATDHDIYAQRLDASGNQLWTTAGAAVTTASADERFPQVISDGAGGAVVCWEDSRNASTQIYANRLDQNGSLMWPSEDVAVSRITDAVPHRRPSMALEANGTIFFAWTKEISTTDWNVEYSGHSLDGALQFGIFNMHTITDGLEDHAVVVPSADGTIVVWEATLPGGTKNIYANKRALTGGLMWAPGNTPVVASDVGLNKPNTKPRAFGDGSGGVLISWEYEFSSTDHDVWAQHIASDGVPKWMSGGFVGQVISEGTHVERNPVMASDGSGGAYIVWEDNRSGNWDIYGDRIDATGTLVGIEDDVLSALPTNYELEQNYPNPFNPTTEIRFATPRSGEVTLTVHNMLGQTVRTLVSGTVEAGNHTVTWNGKNDRGEGVSSGIYLYRMTAGNEVSSKKMMLIR